MDAKTDGKEEMHPMKLNKCSHNYNDCIKTIHLATLTEKPNRYHKPLFL